MFLCMLNDWICVWSTCNFFFNYAKCIVNNEDNVQLIQNIGACMNESIERKKKYCKSMSRQNWPEVNLNAIDITVHAYTCTPYAFIKWISKMEHTITHTYGHWSYLVEVKTRESFISCQVRPSTRNVHDEHTYVVSVWVRSTCINVLQFHILNV